MAKKRQTTGVKGFIVFVLLILIIGAALLATGNFDSPFAAISELAAVNSLVEGSKPLPDQDSAMQPLPPTEGLDGSSLGVSQEQDSLPLAESSSDEGQIDWSLIGNVVFDLWFFCAVTAVIVVVQKVLTTLAKVIQSQIRPTARE